MAYAVVLLDWQSNPVLFWGDLCGVNGPNGPKPASYGRLIAKLAMIRKLYAYGPQNDYFDNPSCVGFTRLGSATHSNGAGIAVVISKSRKPQTKRMNVGRQHGGERWTDMLRGAQGEVRIDDEGWGLFPIQANQGSGCVAVWSHSAALDRGRLDTVNLAI